MKGCLTGVIALVVLFIIIGRCVGPSEREECLAEARATTEVRRLDGWFSSQYEEDTFRRQQEAWCRTLYD